MCPFELDGRGIDSTRGYTQAQRLSHDHHSFDTMQLIYSSIAFALLNAVAAEEQESQGESKSELSPSITRFKKHHNPQTNAPLLTAPQGGTPTVGPSSALPTSAETGVFTVPGAGSYDVTYISNAYDVAGHVLTVGGGDALVGGVIVTAASSGFVANGQTVELAPITLSTSSTLGTAQTTVTQTGTGSAVNVGTPTASATSSAGGAMVTGGSFGAAVLGGVVAGALML
ncbi:hypothetical protein HII31_03624 [Pseudocercospora fuligena]|uniref:Uncharacterized protein n=1 Tax=Pseudocercospora fuligena TaxID=685502 RepID=A0A8H6VKF2_9PEZI|nr:hypothetical protein HII31_03624 [Pseudocercospora fuligena]